MTYSNNNSGASSAQYVDSGTTPGSGAEVLRQGSTFYDTASTRVEQAQRIDVTEQIRLYHDLYGGSDNTSSSGLAASKSLNYAPAPTMQRSQLTKTSIFPFTYTLAGQVGLFGAENYYLRVDLDLIEPLNPEFEETDWMPADIDYIPEQEVNTYEPEYINFDADPPPPPNTQSKNDKNVCTPYRTSTAPLAPTLYNCYMAALISNPAPNFYDPVVSIELEDIGTGNIYIDTWLEPMLYTRERKMWGYDKMYIRPRDHFYVGIHARNTRHLPYNIKVKIGYEYIQSADVAEKELIAGGGLIYQLAVTVTFLVPETGLSLALPELTVQVRV